MGPHNFEDNSKDITVADLLCRATESEVYLIIWKNQQHTQVLEVWDNYEIACNRRDKFWSDIERRIGFIRKVMNSYRETVYVETHKIKRQR